jgi:hypothetical protein
MPAVALMTKPFGLLNCALVPTPFAEPPTESFGAPAKRDTLQRSGSGEGDADAVRDGELERDGVALPVAVVDAPAVRDADAVGDALAPPAVGLRDAVCVGDALRVPLGVAVPGGGTTTTTRILWFALSAM